ncbi:uncharacterized protein [Pagrus major]|uniref:uncharacterized protein n=1 Tax=Pagrus major TaxID=143350 RepID=UPI003CC885AD
MVPLKLLVVTLTFYELIVNLDAQKRCPKECSECEAGYFSTSIDSTCRKWRECKSGVQKNGTKISDVICKDESKSDTYVSATPTPHNIVPAVKRFTSDRPHEGAQTQKIHTTTTTSAPRHMTPVPPPTTGSQIGVILIIGMGLVLLLVLTAVACKQHAIPKERQQPEQKSESLCRKPVEESGDSNEALFKQNP